jgi:7-keto-8-aminopelargonate synthetase-like enzyme
MSAYSTTDQAPGRTITIAGQSFLFFSGYAYLGMSQVPAFTELVKEGIDRYGLSFPSSRISNTRLSLFEEMEQLLSDITGQEATVCFASGFTAGSQAASLLPANKQAAPGTHPAVYKGQPVKNSFDAWVQHVVTGLTAHAVAPALVADAVNIFAPCLNDFSFLEQCPVALTALIDDSHGIGITGNNGEGVSSRMPPGHTLILSYSLSKAFNLVGGAVSCNTEMAERLRRSPEYTAATALSPAFAYAFIKGQALYQQQRKKLQHNIAVFRQLTRTIPEILSVPELPIFILPATTNEQRLYEQGILISSFAYPDPQGPKIQRVVLNALHTEEDLYRLSIALQEALVLSKG